MKRIPVVLDTDIGGDIDDVWALCYLLKCPELEPQLVLTASEDTTYKAKVVCKFLEAARRTDLPVGVGVPTEFDPAHKTHLEWIKDYDGDRYRGVVMQDGVGALVDRVRASPEPVTLVCIGP